LVAVDGNHLNILEISEDAVTVKELVVEILGAGANVLRDEMCPRTLANGNP